MATLGMTQEGLISPTLFNMVVDNVVRTWMEMTVKDQVLAQEGLGINVGRRLGVFYANYGIIGSRESE